MRTPPSGASLHFLPPFLTSFFLIALLVIGNRSPVHAGEKVALLVGIDKYEKRHFADRPLSFAERDVTVLADALKQHGFEVRALKGSSSGVQRATKANIDRA